MFISWVSSRSVCQGWWFGDGIALNCQPDIIKRYRAFLLEAMQVSITKGFKVGLGDGMVFGACFCTYALGFWYGGKLIADAYDAGCNPYAGDDCITGGTIMMRFYKMPFIVISFHYSSTCLLIIQFIFPCCDLFARLFSSPLSWVQSPWDNLRRRYLHLLPPKRLSTHWYFNAHNFLLTFPHSLKIQMSFVATC